MKSGLKLLLPAALALVGLMASCTSSPADSSTSTTSTTSTTSEAPATTTLKVGYGYYAFYASKSSGTVLQTDVSYVGIVLDEDDTIVDFKIDVMQVKASATNATTTALTSTVFPDTTDVKTKWDLLEDYNMNGAAGEWYEQAKDVEEYAVGKDLTTFKTELLAGISGVGLPTAGVSIKVSDFGTALGMIVNKDFYSEIEVAEADVANVKLGIGLTSVHEAKRTNVNMGTALFLNDVVLAAEVDSLQIPYAITEVAGEPITYTIAADATKLQVDHVKTIVMSKVYIGEVYGMNAPAGEYYEQAESFEAYVTGKTLANAFSASATTMGDHGLVFVEGATIGVTIGIEDLVAVLEEAETVSGPRVIPS